MIKKITLDTNCFFDYYGRNPVPIQDLIDLQEQGYIEIAMTTRVLADTYDKSRRGSSQIWANIQTFPIVETIGTVGRVGSSRVGSGDFVASEEDTALISNLQQIMTGAQTEDVDHLFGHIKAKRDIFVTRDEKHILVHQELLKQKFNAVVLKPKDAVLQIKKDLK